MVWIEGCQIEVKRYALLDTDFISKTHSVQDDGGNHLIDRVMELPEYEFFCHAQIVTELNRYNADTPIWLSEKIGAQKIKSYTDQEILESLSLVRGPLACATYTQMLKLACDAFSKNYFSEHYRALEEADYTVISREDYLKELERLDIEVGKKNNLGEIKSFVLLQVLSVMLGEQIYVFCSDDKNARNGATNFEDVRCISLVSVFSRLKEESNWTLADAEPYIESLIAFYQDLELSRRGGKVNIGKYGSTEVDFVTQKEGVLTYYQVTADMTAEETFEREMRPLRSIQDNYEKIVLTLDRFSLGNYDGIKVVNVIDWLLG